MNPVGHAAASSDNNAGGNNLADFAGFGSSEPAGDLFDAAIPPQIAPVDTGSAGNDDYTAEELQMIQ